LFGERTTPVSWHKRLGHPVFRIVHRVLSKFKLPVISNKADPFCSACAQAKGHQLPFYPFISKVCKPLQLIHSDVWGPSPTISVNGNRYYVSFIDVFTRYTWVFPIQAKSDVMSTFLKFQVMVERLLNHKIISVQSDWGGEYRNLHTYFQSVGIIHRLSCPHTHQQQGCVERKHMHLIDTTLALLADSHLPKKLWDEACLTSCYLINRMPTPVLQNQSPFEKNFHTTPDYTFLKIFGCACYPNLRPYNSHKFSPRSKECVFLGYSQHHKGYKCLHLESDRMYISRDVIFHEDRFPFSKGSPLPESSSVSLPVVLPPSLFPPPSTTICPPDSPSILSSPSQSSLAISNNSSAVSSMPCSTSSADQPPARVHSMRTRSMNNIVHPRQLTDGRIRYPVPHAFMAAASPANIEPTCYSNAAPIPE